MSDVGNFAIVALRLFLAYTSAASANPGSRILGILALFAIVTTIVAWTRGTPDRTWRGVTVAFLHLAVLLVVAGQPSYLWQSVFLGGLAIQLWSKAYLWMRTTVSSPVFVTVEARGPYAIVRHPMNLGELVMGLALVCENPTWQNVSAGVFLVWSKVAIIKCEEGFLKQYYDYRDYCRRVATRLIPGVW